MGEKEWTPEREAAVLAAAEAGVDVTRFGAPVPNPLRKVGRPSLSASGGTSKTLNARIPAELHGKITALADEEGRSVSDLTRDALDALVARGRPSAGGAGAVVAQSGSELIDVVAQRLGGPGVAAEAIEAVLAGIVAAVERGERVAVVGFGTFEKAPDGEGVRVTPAKAKAAARSDDSGGGGSRKRAKPAAAPAAPKKAKARKAG